jgi:hypothetical protein
MDTALSALGKRVFLMNNVHEDEPVVFETRWALSYLRGPLTRQHIQTLMTSQRAALAPAPKQTPGAGSTPNAPAPQASGRPLVPTEANETYLAVASAGSAKDAIVYRPTLTATAKLHFVKANCSVDVWNNVTLMQTVGDTVPDNVWENARSVDPDSLDIEDAPMDGATFTPLPTQFTSPANYTRWTKAVKDHVYQCQVLSLWRSAELKKVSQAGESEADFRVRLSQTAHEKRDLDVEKLRKTYRPKLATLKDRLMRAQQRVEKEKAQSRSTALASAVSFGSTVLSAFLGRKLVSKENVTRAGSALKSAARTADQMGDVGQAEDTVEEIERKIGELEAEFEVEVKKLEQPMSGDSLELEAVEVRPRKSDTVVEKLSLVWTPWRRDASGQYLAAFREPDEIGCSKE